MTTFTILKNVPKGQELDLQQFAGDVMVIVNTASKCS